VEEANVVSKASSEVAQKAKELYESRLREEIEEKFQDKYVSIEPQSGDYFVGATFDEAVNAALDAHPDRLTYTLRVGHPAALHLGGGESDGVRR
jgi:hypothetical protein